MKSYWDGGGRCIYLALYIFSHDLLMNISYYHSVQTHPNAYKENLDIFVI